MLCERGTRHPLEAIFGKRRPRSLNLEATPLKIAYAFRLWLVPASGSLRRRFSESKPSDFSSFPCNHGSIASAEHSVSTRKSFRDLGSYLARGFPKEYRSSLLYYVTQISVCVERVVFGGSGNRRLERANSLKSLSNARCNFRKR